MTDIEVGKLYVRYDFEELKFIIPLSSEIVVVYESDCFKCILVMMEYISNLKSHQLIVFNEDYLYSVNSLFEHYRLADGKEVGLFQKVINEDMTSQVEHLSSVLKEKKENLRLINNLLEVAYG